MQTVEDLLAVTGLPFARYAWDPKPKGDYGVIGFLSEVSLEAGNRTAERGTQYYVDYYTRSDGEAVRAAISAALAPLSGRLDYTEYERDTGYLHMEWVVAVYG